MTPYTNTFTMRHLRILYTLIFGVAAVAASAQQVRWAGAEADSLRAEALIEASQRAHPWADAQTRVADIAREFLDIPYVGGTLEGTPEMLTADLTGVDCTTLVDQTLALAMTAAEGRRTWRDFAYNLQKLRYRDGRVDGYGSRLHYISDWVMDLSRRGVLREVTTELQGSDFEVKSLDYMSRHADAYPALADPEALARIRSLEQGYRNHRFPMVKTRRVSSRTLGALRSGDIIAFTTSVPGLDVSHLAIVMVDDKGTVNMLHASSRAGKVVIDSLPLQQYLQRNRKLTGIRVFRLAE